MMLIFALVGSRSAGAGKFFADNKSRVVISSFVAISGGLFVSTFSCSMIGQTFHSVGLTGIGILAIIPIIYMYFCRDGCKSASGSMDPHAPRRAVIKTTAVFVGCYLTAASTFGFTAGGDAGIALGGIGLGLLGAAGAIFFTFWMCRSESRFWFCE